MDQPEEPVIGVHFVDADGVEGTHFYFEGQKIREHIGEFRLGVFRYSDMAWGYFAWGYHG